MHPHTHAIDCVIDPAMPAAVRPMRWPELRANPLHRGRTAMRGAERRLLAAAIAQDLNPETPMPHIEYTDSQINQFGDLTRGGGWGVPSITATVRAIRSAPPPPWANAVGVATQLIKVRHEYGMPVSRELSTALQETADRLIASRGSKELQIDAVRMGFMPALLDALATDADTLRRHIDLMIGVGGITANEAFDQVMAYAIGGAGSQ